MNTSEVPSEVPSECGVYIHYVTYLMMTVFFVLGYIFFSMFKIESRKDVSDFPSIHELDISRKSQEDKIRSFFTDFCEEQKGNLTRRM